MAVKKINFKCNDSWFVQKVGLVLGAFLAFIVANFWFKVYEKALALDISQKIDFLEDNIGKFVNGIRRATFRTNSAVECEICLSWYHRDYGHLG